MEENGSSDDASAIEIEASREFLDSIAEEYADCVNVGALTEDREQMRKLPPTPAGALEARALAKVWLARLEGDPFRVEAAGIDLVSVRQRPS